MVVEDDDTPAARLQQPPPPPARHDETRPPIDAADRSAVPTGGASAAAAFDEENERVVAPTPVPAQTPALPQANAESEHPQIDLPLDEGEPMPGDIRPDPGETPSFVREAERAARWRQPWVRGALGVACAVAGLALASQWLLAQRDAVAARSPALKPLLTAGCAALGCNLNAPRALDALRVESSGLVRVEKSELYRLSVALRNLRGHEVALPAFELALTDTQGQLIARRVLRADEIGARSSALAASAELMLQATIQVGSGTVAGYTIELFYP